MEYTEITDEMANAIKTMIENEELRNKFSVNAFNVVEFALCI